MSRFLDWLEYLFERDAIKDSSRFAEGSNFSVYCDISLYIHVCVYINMPVAILAQGPVNSGCAKGSSRCLGWASRGLHPWIVYHCALQKPGHILAPG